MSGSSGIEVNGRRFAWEAGVKLQIGRDPTCDIVLDDPKVSRVHVRIETTPDGAWQLVDAGSTNGTWVDGRRVGQLAVTSSMTVSLDQSGNGAVVELVLLTDAGSEPQSHPVPEHQPHPVAEQSPHLVAMGSPEPAPAPAPEARPQVQARPQVEARPQVQAQAVQVPGPVTAQLERVRAGQSGELRSPVECLRTDRERGHDRTRGSQ